MIKQGGIATALRMAPIPDHFREQLINNLPVTPEAPEDGIISHKVFLKSFCRS